MNLVRILKAISDENRLRILELLNQKELCVCELESILGMTQSNVSRHLIKLKDAEIIESEKNGQFVFCKINPQALALFPFLKNLLDQELIKIKKFQNDQEKLKKLNDDGLMCIRENCQKS